MSKKLQKLKESMYEENISDSERTNISCKIMEEMTNIQVRKNKKDWKLLIKELESWKKDKPFTNDEQPTDDVIDNAINYCLYKLGKEVIGISPDSCVPSGNYRLEMEWNDLTELSINPIEFNKKIRTVEFINEDKVIFIEYVKDKVFDKKFIYRSKNYV